MHIARHTLFHQEAVCTHKDVVKAHLVELERKKKAKAKGKGKGWGKGKGKQKGQGKGNEKREEKGDPAKIDSGKLGTGDPNPGKDENDGDDDGNGNGNGKGVLNEEDLFAICESAPDAWPEMKEAARQSFQEYQVCFLFYQM